MWIVFALCSALFLGMYDILRKISLKDNPVIPIPIRSTGPLWTLLGALLIFSDPKRKQNKPFRLSPYIFLIGLVLSVSDFLYFYSLSYFNTGYLDLAPDL